MKRSPSTLVSSFALAILAGCAGTATAPAIKTPSLPDAIAAPTDQKIAFAWQAIGTQIYECKLNDKSAPAWAFVAPEAELMNAKNEKVGTHGAGPHWMGLDGSRIVGVVKGRAPGVSTQDIPLLLLEVKSSSGQGKMNGIKSIQRINTVGGQPPSTGCVAQADLGKRSVQGYASDYVFWMAK